MSCIDVLQKDGEEEQRSSRRNEGDNHSSLTEEQKKLLEVFRPVYEHLCKEFSNGSSLNSQQGEASGRKKKHTQMEIEEEKKKLSCKHKLAYLVHFILFIFFFCLSEVGEQERVRTLF